MKIKPCPSCGSVLIGRGRILNNRICHPVLANLLPHRWYLICWGCHHRGPTRVTLRRAVWAWNRRKEAPDV